MRRIPDVLDCWFDSGSMPFAQLHYPFEHAQRFEEHFPADFIVEYVGQTRGWFYTLHVLATALFDRPPFKACIAHGIVLGDDGRKLSKRLRNFPDPEEVFASYGADAMRWYLLASPVLRGSDVVIEEKGLAEPIRLVCNPIWNTWYFLSMYADADGLGGRVRTDQTGVLDRYILAKTRRLVEDVTAAMETYDLAGATGHISLFLDALTNWYVRRSRDRFWRPVNAAAPAANPGAPGGPPDDKQDAYDTLHTVLEVLCRVAAPFLPFLSEAVYRGLTGQRSVHLKTWPAADELPVGPGSRGGDGPRPRGVLSRALDPQGGRAPRPPAPVVPDGGGPGGRPPSSLRRLDRRRGERATGQAARDRRRPGRDGPQRRPRRPRPAARGRAPSTSSRQQGRANGPSSPTAPCRPAACSSKQGEFELRLRPAEPELEPDPAGRGGDRRPSSSRPPLSSRRKASPATSSVSCNGPAVTRG